MKTPDAEEAPVVGARAQYELLAVDRLPFLERARESSKLTIPSLITPEGHSGTRKLYKPFQSLGARGVNNLSARLLMALFPTNQPFSRFKIDEVLLQQQLKDNKELKTQLDEALAKSERAIQNEIETSGTRKSAFQAIKQLVVAGNALAYSPRKGGLRVFKLSQYVVLRDHEGNLLEIILKETLAPASLPLEYRKFCVDNSTKETLKTVDLYTKIKLTADTWYVHQEVEDIIIVSTVGTHKKDELPWIALRWTEVQGENYGHSHVEDGYGDLQSLEGLRQAIVEGSAAAAKVLMMVNPNGSTSAKNVAQAANGAVIEGNATDVTVLQMNKYNDFRVAKETITEISDQLSKHFLLTSSIQRNADRQTATEWRIMTEELETSLGGVYAVLSQTFQLPLVQNIILNLQKANRFPKYPKNLVRPLIVTGLEALGRSSDLNKLDQFISEIGQQFGPDAVAKYVNPTEYLTRKATALGIDIKNLIFTQEDIAAQQEAQQQQQTMQSLAPQLVKGGADLLNTKAKLTAQQPPAQP